MTPGDLPVAKERSECLSGTLEIKGWTMKNSRALIAGALTSNRTIDCQRGGIYKCRRSHES